MMNQLGGVIAPVTTPFSSEGDLLIDAMVRNVEKYWQAPLDGILVLGSTGEAAHLALEERLQVVEEIAPLIPSGKSFLAGISSATLRGVLGLIDRFGHLRIDGVLVSVPPYYKNRMDDRALYGFFEATADHSPFPILLYNIPRFSGVSMSLELVKDLSAHPNIVGMKDSSADLIYMQQVMDATQGNDFLIITGSAETLSSALVLGVRCGILAVACVIPAFVDDLLTSFELRLPSLPAKQIQLCRISCTLVRALGVPGVKYAMDLQGYEGGFCRLPLAPLTGDEQRRAEKVLEGVRMAGT